ncbi:6-carboxytetrahydropterin synthase [Accumulibacter sp.]|uniref:6-pyruvoyl trahydropterin synthase family protein n=1 Tax=Accumulibacter sp. TaxID=2053492 RepID=UPI00260AAAB8|nr:6-carboxytetrahydropterin synthase [Accumulibacter sp.]
MLITRRLEFDAGHRIPDHKSQCRHLHGHRYAMEITLAGDIIQREGDPANGMVMDFSAVKALAARHLVDAWDHAFLVWSGDRPVVEFLRSLPDHKTVLLDCVPTAENLAQEAFAILAMVYRDIYANRLQLVRLRLYETPNCWAEAVAPDGADDRDLRFHAVRRQPKAGSDV